MSLQKNGPALIPRARLRRTQNGRRVRRPFVDQSFGCSHAKFTRIYVNFLHAKDSFCTLLRALAVSKVVSKTDFGDETTRIYVLNMPFRKQASECIRIYMPKIPFDRMRVYARCYGPAQISHSCAGSPKRYPHRARLTPSFRTVPHAMGFRAVLEPPDSEMATL